MAEKIDPGRCPDDCAQYIPGYRGELLEVTSLSRPDTRWRFVDARGHEHRWYSGGVPAEGYSPMRSYSLPTLMRIVDSPGDDWWPEIAHYECTACRAIEGQPTDGTDEVGDTLRASESARQEAERERDILRAQLTALEAERDELRHALADIAFSDDMTLTVARNKAKRIYRKSKPQTGRQTEIRSDRP